jgi:hypothetical protein
VANEPLRGINLRKKIAHHLSKVFNEDESTINAQFFSSLLDVFATSTAGKNNENGKN